MCKKNEFSSKAWIASFIALIVPIVLSLSFLVKEDILFFLSWAGFFVFSALLAYPLTAKFFPNSPDRGFSFAFLLGILVPAFLIWTLAYLGIPVFSTWPIRGILLILCVHIIVHLVRKKQFFNTKDPASLHAFGPIHIFEIALFLTAFFAWTYVRSHKPEIFDLEKFMDYGFMMSMWRNSKLPALDMWMAGENINYYYFGQYLFTYISKATSVHPQYSYNLSMAASFALSFMAVFGLVRDILIYRVSMKYEKIYQATDIRVQEPKSKFFSWRTVQAKIIPNASGLLAALLLCLGGNSHAFFYKEGAFGNKILLYFTRMGYDLGNIYNFFFADSTRFIGYNPETSDKTIHEFPYYSYLVGDLHAHMINLSVTLLIIALLFSLYSKFKSSKILSSRNLMFSPQFIGLAFAMGISSMANYWDYVIYLVVIVFTLILILLHTHNKFFDWLDIILSFIGIIFLSIGFLLIQNPIVQVLYFLAISFLFLVLEEKRSSVWAKLMALLSFILFASHFMTIPFSLHFEPMAKRFSLVENRSGLYALFILWFAHVGIAIIYLFSFFISNRRKPNMKQDQSILRHYLGQNTADIFQIILIISAFGLILAPEFIYVKDIYDGDFKRANTMFKFTYQSFSLLTVVAAYTFGSLIQRVLPKLSSAQVTVITSEPTHFNLPKRYQEHRSSSNLTSVRAKTVVPILLVLVLIGIPFVYTPSIFQWYGTLLPHDIIGLEGTSYYASHSLLDQHGTEHSLQDRQAMSSFLNNEVEGQPHILEAYGDSYSLYNVISAYTGLPTVIGWQTHEWLWRTSQEQEDAFQELVIPLQKDVAAIYEGQSSLEVIKLIEKYDIEYIIVAEQERILFPNINEELLISLGEYIYLSDENNYILKIIRN